MTIEILRSARAQKLTGRPRSSFYQQISQGLLPPPIKLGTRAVGWLASEIEAVNKARVQGKSDDEIKILVASLIKQRLQL